MKWLQRLFIPRNLAIVRSDGGICSQIAFRAAGEELSSGGADVRYDLSWFRLCGKDDLGNPTRNFQLNLLCPSIVSPEATVAECERICRLGYYREFGGRSIGLRPPGYFAGYPDIACLLKHRRLFADSMNPARSAELDRWLEVCDSGSCAVHVRRGDLAVSTGLTPRGACSTEYILAAVERVLTETGINRFIFFSDDPAYVRDWILPQMPKSVVARLCDMNDQLHGYLDLYLMCHCRWVIGTEGSASVFSRLLTKNPQPGGIVLPRNGRYSQANDGAHLGKLIFLDGWNQNGNG